ncbi:prion-like-(Q/N-rich) domain-bearing protein 25 isoform X3 [Aedes aegypti]|uniref:EGF-like domain-containing protein n=1 Tax=Aedes aegypti TaxID=7159 RepID=A0A1S4F238_AEDAE|nr:prion-like-(Q/N-rich) domain-bearing protein 25 isoform X3 [Aedes aegypti]
MRWILAKWFLVILIVRESRSVVWPCTTSADCGKVPEATCSIYGFCQCPAGHVFSTDVSRCLPESAYGVRCEEAVQCSHMLTGAKCENQVCTCDTGFTYVRGRCRQLANLDQPCNEDIDCFFSYNREAVECRDGKCQCAPGFYLRSTNVCRREVTLGDRCLVNEDCVGEDLECKNDFCAKKEAQTKTYRDIGVQAKPTCEEKKAQADVRVTRDQQQQTSISSSNCGTATEGGDINSGVQKEAQEEKRKESNSSGATAKRVRLQSSVDDPSTKDDSTPGYGDTCRDETEPCTGLPYSVCRMGQCICQEGFYPVGKVCKAEMGEYVDRKEDCGSLTDETKFVNGRCVCDNHMFYNYNMRTCLKGALGINTSCTQNSQCSPYGAAYCPLETPKRCTCYPYAEYDSSRQMCVGKKGFEEYCEKDEDCTLSNTRCSEAHTCVCRPNFFYVNERCKAAQGGTCETVDDCGFEKASCESEDEQQPKKCDCMKGYLYRDNTCLKEAEAYEEECTVNEQCQPLLGNLSKCMDEKCKCDESDTHFKDGKCHPKKALEERCQLASECFVEDQADNVECRNSSCQCKFDYSPDVERQRCVRPSGKSSSDRPSALKVITLLLTSAAILITGSALRDAYYA